MVGIVFIKCRLFKCVSSKIHAKYMKLSIIIPAFKVAPYIFECLLSVLCQKTNFDFEVIVCDDASTDSTYKIINYLASSYPNLVVLKNELNLGLVATMKRLLESVKGQYIAYLDGDDVALPGKLQLQVDYLDANPLCSMVYHESDMFNSVSGNTIKYYSRDFYNAHYIPQKATIDHLVKYTVFLQASSIMFRRYPAFIDALAHGNNIICDYPWHIRNIGLNPGTIDRIDNVFGRYRVHNSSFGGQTQCNPNRRIQVTDELIHACKHSQFFGVNEDTVQFGINHIYFSAALYFLKMGMVEHFQSMLGKSAEKELYFDKRHEFALKHINAPEKVMQHLGWQNG